MADRNNSRWDGAACSHASHGSGSPWPSRSCFHLPTAGLRRRSKRLFCNFDTDHSLARRRNRPVAVQQSVGTIRRRKPQRTIRCCSLGERRTSSLSSQKALESRSFLARDCSGEFAIGHIPGPDSPAERADVAGLQQEHSRRRPEGTERDPILQKLRSPHRH